MTTYRVGDIVSVNFPFADLQVQKRLPGLVLMSDDIDLVVARITTHSPRHRADVALTGWAASGLPHASTVRLTKLATIDHRLVHRTVGHLHPGAIDRKHRDRAESVENYGAVRGASPLCRSPSSEGTYETRIRFFTGNSRKFFPQGSEA